MTSRFLTLLVCVAFCSPVLAQSAVDGKWSFIMTSPFGQVNAAVVMKTEGGLLTGEFDLGGGRKWPIEQGSVDGNTIRFQIIRDGANVAYLMTATVNGDQVSGVASAMGSESNWSMTREE